MICSCDRAACRYTSLPSPCGQYSRLLCKGANIIGVHAVLRKTKNFPLQSLLTGESWVFDFAVIDVGGKCNRILERLTCSARSKSANSRNERVSTGSILAPFCWSFKPTLSNLMFDVHRLGNSQENTSNRTWIHPISIRHDYLQQIVNHKFGACKYQGSDKFIPALPLNMFLPRWSRDERGNRMVLSRNGTLNP